MSLPDLIDPDTLALYLADQNLTDAETALLPTLTAAASEQIRRFCRRKFAPTTLDRVYTVQAPAYELVLELKPVQSVEAWTGLTPILTIQNANTSLNQRASLSYVTSGDGEASMTTTGLQLTRWASGVQHADQVLFASHVTVGALATAIVALGNGWTATVATGMSAWPTANLRPVQAVQACLAPRSADVLDWLDPVDASVDYEAGIVSLGGTGGQARESPRFGPAFGGETSDLSSYGGRNGVRCVFTGDYASPPADVEGYAAEAVKHWLNRLRTDSSLRSESDGVQSWSARENPLPLPSHVLQGLVPHVLHRA